mmetsp:Transcript_84233/g.238697  ORF Transcript_84233/g.238697 Transcript_84233/m.238697 type:complete len:80 (-) Transcript_84233:41-280(-)
MFVTATRPAEASGLMRPVVPAGERARPWDEHLEEGRERHGDEALCPSAVGDRDNWAAIYLRFDWVPAVPCARWHDRWQG